MPHSEPYVNNRVVNERMIHRILKYEIFIFKMQHKIIKQVYKKKIEGTFRHPQFTLSETEIKYAIRQEDILTKTASILFPKGLNYTLLRISSRPSK